MCTSRLSTLATMLLALAPLASAQPASTPAAKKSPAAQAVAHSATAAAATSACNLRTDMRKLWEDHVTWTRVYLIDALADLPAKDATAQRLLANQDDIGNAIKPYYGDAAGAKLTALLRQHITIATDIVTAAKAGNTAAQDAATVRWQTNADEIATFLHGANPNEWPLADMKSMMREHLDGTTAELVAGLKKDWTADIAAYDRVHAQILHMADMLSDGITKQFPKKVNM